MRERSFVVTTAYIKTEPIQVAVFAAAILGERITLSLVAAIVIATAGVLALSWPSRAAREIYSWRPAMLGIAAGGLFALSAVGFRGGITSLGVAGFVPATTVTLMIALTFQTVLLSAWLLVRQPMTLAAIFRVWRVSLPAGFLGAFASEMWFLAFAIQNPAKVRTLALVEILIAGIISRRLFAQTPSLRDVIGCARRSPIHHHSAFNRHLGSAVNAPTMKCLKERAADLVGLLLPSSPRCWGIGYTERRGDLGVASRSLTVSAQGFAATPAFWGDRA